MPGFALHELGWNPDLADNLEPGLVPGRVAAVHRGAFDVWTEAGEVRSRLPGRLMHDGLDVGVGDWVALGDGLIRAVFPRRSAIVRNAAGMTTTAQTLAANVDVAFVVTSLGPDLEPRRIERYLVTIWESGATPEVVRPACPPDRASRRPACRNPERLHVIAAHRAGFLPLRRAFRQSGGAGAPLRAGVDVRLCWA